MQSLASQFYAFAVTVLIGITIGMLFDFYKVTRGIFRRGKAFVNLGDLLFWVVTTVIVFLMLLAGNWGEIRFYVPIGIILGATCYIKLLSSSITKNLLYIIFVLNKIAGLITKVLKVVWLVVTYPFMLLNRLIIIPIGYLGIIIIKVRTLTKRGVRRLIVRPFKRWLLKIKNIFKTRLRK